jgi:hypothetical protein
MEAGNAAQNVLLQATSMNTLVVDTVNRAVRT